MFSITPAKLALYTSLVAASLFFASVATGQKSAVLFPDMIESARPFAEALDESLSLKLETTDLDLAAAVLRTQAPEDPFNQTSAEARALGTGIGCRYFVLVRTGNLRRVSLEVDKYFEAYAAVYVVSSKSGRLIHWEIRSFKKPTPEQANMKLFDSAGDIGREIAARIKADFSENNAEIVENAADDLPFESDPEVRVPLPYRRIKPAYTDVAKLYGIEATVDIEVAIDSAGQVTDTRVVRWAGYGLDESVEKTVRLMQWRPADRKGKSFAMRVLLRYNFKDLENPID